MKKKISIVVGAHPTTKKERITETIQYTILFILSIVFVTWLLHLTDGWLVLLFWGGILGIYCILLYDTWTRQSTDDRKIIDNPIYKNELDTRNKT